MSSSAFKDPLKPEHRGILREYIAFAIDEEVSAIADAPKLTTGGVENRNYRVTAIVNGQKRSFILRCPPEEIPAWRKDDYDLGREYRILQEILPFSIGTPKTWGYDPEGKFFGAPCFLMEYLTGQSLYESLFPSCDYSLLKAYAQRVADITRLPYQSSPWLREYLPRWTEERWMNWILRRARTHKGDPLYEYALKWLKERQPKPGKLIFCHGDVNPTNFLVSNGRISGVVDWEFASLRDNPLGEVEFFCWLYDGELVRRGFTSEYCKAVGGDEEELEWFFARSWFGMTFAHDDTSFAKYHFWCSNLARCVGYLDE